MCMNGGDLLSGGAPVRASTVVVPLEYLDLYDVKERKKYRCALLSFRDTSFIRRGLPS